MPIFTSNLSRAKVYSPWRTSIHIILALTVLVTALAWAPTTVRASEITVHGQGATANFPDDIIFELQATVSEPVERIELRYRPVGAPVTQVVRPDPPTGTDIDIEYSLDMRTRYLPPGIDIVYRWSVTLEDGSTVQTPEQTLHYMHGGYNWESLTEGQVTIYSYAGGEAFRRDAMDVTQGAIERFVEAFDLTINDDVRVVMYANNREFSEALPPNSAEWIGGFANPGLRLIVMGVPPDNGPSPELRRILSHEVIHLMVDAAATNPFNHPPAWLDEGLATYYQDIPDLRFAHILREAIDEGRLIPLRALNASFPDDPDGALLSYAESESIVRFIVEEMGADQMRTLLLAYQEGVSHEEAVQSGLGMSLNELEQRWKDWLGYEGDQEQTIAANDSRTGLLSPAGIGDTIARWGNIVPMMLAAFVCVIVGTALIIRLLRTPEEPS